MSLLSRLSRLFPRRRAAPASAPGRDVAATIRTTERPSAAPLVAPPVPPEASPPGAADVATASPVQAPPVQAPPFQAPLVQASPVQDGDGLEEVSEAPADDPKGEEAEAGADLGEEEVDDPLSGSGEPLQISLPTTESVTAERQANERLALSGPQKVTLTDPAGPGSLAETLAQLEAEGRLASEIVEDAETGPYILYRPT